MQLSGVPLRFLCAGALLCRAGISAAQIASIPASSSLVQTIPATNEANPFAGSVPTKAVAGVLPLSLQEAIDRGLRQNLGLLLSRADIRSARGQRWQELSALLPHVTAAPYVAASQVNLAKLGLGSVHEIRIPTSVGPFSYFDARAAVTQTLFDWKSINASRSFWRRVQRPSGTTIRTPRFTSTKPDTSHSKHTSQIASAIRDFLERNLQGQENVA